MMTVCRKIWQNNNNKTLKVTVGSVSLFHVTFVCAAPSIRVPPMEMSWLGCRFEFDIWWLIFLVLELSLMCVIMTYMCWYWIFSCSVWRAMWLHFWSVVSAVLCFLNFFFFKKYVNSKFSVGQEAGNVFLNDAGLYSNECLLLTSLLTLTTLQPPSSVQHNRRYLIFYCPLNLFYKCVAFLPVKLVLVALKEVVRTRKIAAGVHHAHHAYHHGFFIMVIVGYVKG